MRENENVSLIIIICCFMPGCTWTCQTSSFSTFKLFNSVCVHISLYFQRFFPPYFFCFLFFRVFHQKTPATAIYSRLLMSKLNKKQKKQNRTYQKHFRVHLLQQQSMYEEWFVEYEKIRIHSLTRRSRIMKYEFINSKQPQVFSYRVLRNYVCKRFNNKTNK